MQLQYKKYFKKYLLTNPGYNVARIAGLAIREKASEYFKGKMLEIGCGTKAKALLVGEYVKTHIGLDHQLSPHDKSNIDVIATAYSIPLDDNTFDCVLSTAVLEHLEEPERALCEAHRVLKPDGYAIYTMPLFWHLHEEPRDFFRFTKYGLRYLFKKAGFEIVEITPLSGFWITFGSELGYYLQSLPKGPFKVLDSLFICFGNLLFFALDKIDRRFHSATVRWTWMYLVVVKKT